METARAAAERKRKSRIRWAFATVMISLFVALATLGPIDRPGEGMLVAGLTGLLGFLLGRDAERRARRFLLLRGRGPRISQSLSGGESPRYQSYDTLEHQFQLTQPAVQDIALVALTTTPFVGSAVADGLTLPALMTDREAIWLLHTHDSAERPVFLDADGILAMLQFTDASADCDALRQALRRLSKLREAAGSPG